MKHLWAVALFLPLAAQEIQSGFELGSPYDGQIQKLLNAKSWVALADYLTYMPAKERLARSATWLKAMYEAGQHEKLVEVVNSNLITWEAKTGPVLGLGRRYRAQSLIHLKRHAEAVAAHLENGHLGDSNGYPNALAVARSTEDWNLLIATAETVLVKKPGHAEATAYKGEALAKQGKFSEAEPSLQAAVKAFPARSTAWSALSICLMERGEHQAGFDAASKAVELDPKYLEARYNRIRASLALQRYEEGRAELVAALALNPEPSLAALLKDLLDRTDRYLEGQAKKAAKAAKPVSKR